MRRCLVVAIMAMLPLMLSCNGVAGIQISAEDAAKYAEQGAEQAVKMGLKALSKDVAAHAKIKSIVEPAKKVIAESVLPLFEGAEVTEVTKATAEQALALLDEKLDPVLKGVIQLGVNVALGYVKMPDNPTDKLSDDAKNIIIAVFNGINAGIGAFEKWDGPGSRDPSPVPVVTKVTWEFGGETP